MSDHYQVLVIGAGPGGYIAALKAAQLGARVAVVEKHHLGGTCLNYGCIPSKALLSSAEMLHTTRQADKWGVKISGEVGFDWGVITAHKDKTIRQLRGGIASLFKGRAVTQLAGAAKFDAPGRVAITAADGSQQLVSADKVIIATGSAPMRIPGWPADPRLVCTSDEAVHWTDLPKQLLIVGGGVIGCEFACMMQSFGVEVTIVELMPRLLPTLDADLGGELLKTFNQRKITCHLDTKVEEMRLVGDSVAVRLSNGESLSFDRALVATGRRPNTSELGLDRAGIRSDRRGFVEVNDLLETNTAGHYTIGDANGRSMLAHAASAQGVAAIGNALGHAKPFDAAIPSAVYTFPEIAAVGMTEQEARDAGLPIAIGRFPIGHLGKAMAARHTEGFVKLIRNRETGQLLGAHMIGHNATECIAAATALIQQKATLQEVAETVWAHPTISESIKEAAEDALGIGLHLPPRKVLRVAAAMAEHDRTAMGKQVTDALDALRSLGTPTEIRALADHGYGPQSPPRVNSHIHLPPNFSAFDSVAQAVKLAAEQQIGVLGVSNYYDYEVYGEFVDMARRRGIFPLFGLEIISMQADLRDAGIKVNDPGNPGKTYLCGKGITRFDAMTPTASRLIADIRRNDTERMAAMVDRVAATFRDRGLDAKVDEAAVIEMIIRRHGSPRETVYLQERHISQAFQESLFAVTQPSNRIEILNRILGTATKLTDAADHIGVQNDLRSHLMKAGKSAFVDEKFLSFDDARQLVLELGGIPSYPVLADGASPKCEFEADPDQLIRELQAREVHAVEWIPLRNRASVVVDYVTKMRAAGLAVTAGTEHNTLDLVAFDPVCKDGPVPDEIRRIFWEGACVAAAHQFLSMHGECGYIDQDGRANPDYNSADARIQALARLGAAVIARYFETNPRN